MLFTNDALAGLADGTITLTFRTWSKAQARTGGRYRIRGLLLHVDSITRVDARSITDAEARRAGSASAEALRQRLEKQGHDGRVWRIEFRCVGEDDRIARRNDSTLDAEKRAKLEARLSRMDSASSTGAWTERTLRLIASHPGVVSAILARRMKMDRPAFKINVRKLKELGLTESLEVGYRLSPLGESFLITRN
jgi:muconolactone delta-isomerase